MLGGLGRGRRGHGGRGEGFVRRLDLIVVGRVAVVVRVRVERRVDQRRRLLGRLQRASLGQTGVLVSDHRVLGHRLVHRQLVRVRVDDRGANHRFDVDVRVHGNFVRVRLHRSGHLKNNIDRILQIELGFLNSNHLIKILKKLKL